jgi:hypothetical protein
VDEDEEEEEEEEEGEEGTVRLVPRRVAAAGSGVGVATRGGPAAAPTGCPFFASHASPAWSLRPAACPPW